jgi:hypothetical protein
VRVQEAVLGFVKVMDSAKALEIAKMMAMQRGLVVS